MTGPLVSGPNNMKLSISLLPIYYFNGGTLAVVISFVKWHSIKWAFLHGLCGWIYVAYYLCNR